MERNEFYEQCKRGYILCETMSQDLTNELILDRPRDVAESKKCLRGFQALFELAVRSMGYPSLGYNVERGKPEVSDWFEDARRNHLGTAQKRTTCNRGQDKSGKECDEYLSGEKLNGLGA
jgi:hypothetical protein